MPKYKYCILDSNKLCNDCGECDVCDLDRNKKCNNCNKCLQGNFDMRGIKIDKIIEDENSTSSADDVDNNSSDNNSQCEFVGDDYTGPDFNEDNGIHR